MVRIESEALGRLADFWGFAMRRSIFRYLGGFTGCLFLFGCEVPECEPAAYYDVEVLGILHEPGRFKEPTPAGPFPLPEPWLQKCQVASVGGINRWGEVVYTRHTAQGPRIFVDAGGVALPHPNQPTIGCHIDDARFISGKSETGMALWYGSDRQDSGFAPYPYLIAPPAAQSGLGILVGTSPHSHRNTPGGVFFLLAAGSYLAKDGAFESALGEWKHELSPYAWPLGQQTMLNGAVEMQDEVRVFGSLPSQGWRPFHLEISDQGPRPPVVYGDGGMGAVHDMNERGAVVGCARQEDGTPFEAFQVNARFQAGHVIVGREQGIDESGSGPVRRGSCLFDNNQYDIAVGDIDGSLGFIWSPVSGMVVADHSEPDQTPFIRRDVVSGKELYLRTVRGIQDDGILAAVGSFRDPITLEEEAHALRLRPKVQVDKVEIRNASGVDSQSGLDIVKGGAIDVLVSLKAPVPTACGAPGIRGTVYWADGDSLLGKRVEAIPYGKAELQLLVELDTTELSAPAIRTIGFEAGGHRREVDFLQAPGLP